MTRLEHLGHAILGLEYDPDTRFAMLTCYLDEAGGEREQSTVVCGWISTAALWEQFAIDWKLFLASYKVPYFHMKEFSQSKGPFKKWDDRRFIRRRFMHDAIGIIRSRVQYFVFCYVDHRLFALADAKYDVTETLYSPYAIAGRVCVAQVDVWSKSQSSPQTCEFIFEDGGPDKSGLLRAMNVSRRLPDPIFKPSRDIKDKLGSVRAGIVQLQAADLLAYELRKHKHEFQVKSGRPIRTSFYEMLKIPWIAMASFNEYNVTPLCQLENPLGRRLVK